MTTTPTLREAAQQFVQDYENGDLGDLKHYARSMRAALAEQAAEQAEPVAYMTEYVSPDAGPQYEIYKADDMGWRDKAHYTPLYSAPPAPARQEPLTVTRQLEAVGRVAEVHMSRYTVEWLDRPYPSGTVLYADIIEAAMNGPRRRREQHALPAAPITAAPAEGEKQ